MTREDRIQVVKSVFEQIIGMIDNDVLCDNGVESFVGWCEDGDVFSFIFTDEEKLAMCKELMNEVADDVDKVVYHLAAKMEE